MSRRVVSIEKIDLSNYHLVVEFTKRPFFSRNEQVWHQHYRGSITLKLYPQGEYMWDHELLDWLTAQVQQFEWSQEHAVQD